MNKGTDGANLEIYFETGDVGNINEPGPSRYCQIYGTVMGNDFMANTKKTILSLILNLHEL